MTYAKSLSRIALILVIGQIAVGCAAVVDSRDVHYANTSCSTCSGHFPHTGGDGHRP